MRANLGNLARLLQPRPTRSRAKSVQSSPPEQVQQRLSFAQLIRARELESLLALDARWQRIERTIAEVR